MTTMGVTMGATTTPVRWVRWWGRVVDCDVGGFIVHVRWLRSTSPPRRNCLNRQRGVWTTRLWNQASTWRTLSLSGQVSIEILSDIKSSIFRSKCQGGVQNMSHFAFLFHTHVQYHGTLQTLWAWQRMSAIASFCRAEPLDEHGSEFIHCLLLHKSSGSWVMKEVKVVLQSC